MKVEFASMGHVTVNEASLFLSSFRSQYSRTMWFSRYQKVKLLWILMEDKMLQVTVVHIGTL